jgi:hypothetical protein
MKISDANIKFNDSHQLPKVTREHSRGNKEILKLDTDKPKLHGGHRNCHDDARAKEFTITCLKLP